MRRIPDGFFYSFIPGFAVGWSAFGLVFGATVAPKGLGIILLLGLVLYYLIGWRTEKCKSNDFGSDLC